MVQISFNAEQSWGYSVRRLQLDEYTVNTSSTMNATWYNHTNGSTTETTSMTMMTTDMYRPGMNHSNGSTTETTSMTRMTSTSMMMTAVARLEGCMGLSVSNASTFAWNPDATRVLEQALARAAGGGVMAEHISVSIMPGASCDSGQMSTTWFGGRLLQGAPAENVRVDYVIHFYRHAGAEAAIQAAEHSKRAIEEISHNQMNQLVSEEMFSFPSLTMHSVSVLTPPTVRMIVTYPNMNHSNGSTTETTSMTMMMTTGMYRPGMNHSNGSTTETTSMTRMTSTSMMMTAVARLEGCMGLSVSDSMMFAGNPDAARVLEQALARAAGGGVMAEHISVSIMPGASCDSGQMSTTWSGGRLLQGAPAENVRVDYVIHFYGHAGAEAAIQAAEHSKRAIEEISHNQMNQLVSEEMFRFPSLTMHSVSVLTPPTVRMIVTYPNMNHSNGSTTETTSMTMMMTTGMYRPGMNHSNGSTTETTSMTRMTSTSMMMTAVARLEGCMGLSVSDSMMFAGNPDAARVLEQALARAAGGGVMAEHISVSIMPGASCDSGQMSTTWSGGRLLQGAPAENVRVDYVIHFYGHAGAEAAIQAAEHSKRAIEEISHNQMNQLVSEEMFRFPSLTMHSVSVLTPPTVRMIVTYPNMNHSNGSTTETTSMTMMMTTGMYRPGMNHSNGSTTETTSMTRMTSTSMMMTAVARLEGCMGLSVSDSMMFAGNPDAFRVLEQALARAAGGGVMAEHISLSIMPGASCDSGQMSTTWSGGRLLQGAPAENVRVDYVIHFYGHAGAEAAIQVAEHSKRAIEEISLNQMNQLVSEEMFRFPSLTMHSVSVLTPPTVRMIVTYPNMNHSNGSTTETTSMTMMMTTGMYRPGMNHSNGSTTETTSMTRMTSTSMMMTAVARLEGCMGLSVSDSMMFAGNPDAFRGLEQALARAAGGGVMAEHISVSIMPGATCDSGQMSTTWSGGRLLQGAPAENVRVDYVIHFYGHAGAEAAIQAAEHSKRAVEEISLNQMNQLVSEEMFRFPSLTMHSVSVLTPPTVRMIVTYPNMNHSNGSTTETTSMTMMMTTGMYRPGMNHSNGSTTETTSMTRMTSTSMMMTAVARLEGCMGLSVSDSMMFAGNPDAFRVLEKALARAAGGGVMAEHISVSIMPGATCDSGQMSTTWSGGRLLQGAPAENVRVDYVIHFYGHAGAEAAIQAAEHSKRAVEEISLNQMNQLVSEEMFRFPSLTMHSVSVLTPPTVRMIVTYPNMNHSNGSTTETTSMTMMMTTGMYRPGMNHSNGSTTETTSMTRMTSTSMMMTAVARLEGCMGLSVSDSMMFAGNPDAFRVLEQALARAAGGGVMAQHISVSIMPGATCDSGQMSTTWSGGRLLQGAPAENVRVDYVIHFYGHAGAEAAIQAAEHSKRAVEEISLNQMNQLVSEEMFRFPSLTMHSVSVLTPPTVRMIVTYPNMNHSNGSTTETTSMTMMMTTGMYRPGMNHSNGSTTETTSMTRMTSTSMMMTAVARLEGCMGLSVSDSMMFAGNPDAFRVLEHALARAAGGGVMAEHISVSIMPGATCDSGQMSTTWSGGRLLQGAPAENVRVDYVIHFYGHAGAEAAIQAAEHSKRAVEEISLNQMNQLVSEEMFRFPSLTMHSVSVLTPPTVRMIVTYPNMNHSNGSTTETTSMTMMMTTGMYRPGMNHSNGSTTETTSMTRMTSTSMMMTAVARLEGCMGLSVSDSMMFAGNPDAFRVLEQALARAAGGGVMAEHISVSIMPGATCDSGQMSTTWSGGRLLQGAPAENVRVDYVIHFYGHAGAEAAIQAAEHSKRAVEEISLNQMNQLVSEEMFRFPSLTMHSVSVLTPPTVRMIVTYPNMNHSNGSTTETTSMTMMMTTGMYRPGMNHSNGSTTETTSMTRMTSTSMMTAVARLEGCMGLSVSDAMMFAGNPDSFRVLEQALARAAGGGVMAQHVSVSIMPGASGLE